MGYQRSELVWGESVYGDTETTVRRLGRALDVRYDAHPAAVHPELDRKVGGWVGLNPVHLKLLVAAISTLEF